MSSRKETKKPLRIFLAISLSIVFAFSCDKESNSVETNLDDFLIFSLENTCWKEISNGYFYLDTVGMGSYLNTSMQSLIESDLNTTSLEKAKKFKAANPNLLGIEFRPSHFENFKGFRFGFDSHNDSLSGIFSITDAIQVSHNTYWTYFELFAGEACHGL